MFSIAHSAQFHSPENTIAWTRETETKAEIAKCLTSEHCSQGTLNGL